MSKANKAKTALVTGGNRGIGLAIVTGLAELGHRVIIGSRDATAGQAAATKIGAEAVRLDVADRTSIEQCAKEVGEVDMLINNAGVLHHAPLLEDPQHFEESMKVMLRGPYHLIRTFVPGMRERKWGRIVNVSSGWGAFSDGVGGPNAYGVAKAALNALTVAVARELPKSIKVNSMCPGWVRTRMGGRTATRSPEEGADTAIWLATLPHDGPTGGFFRDRKAIEW